ncbi:hypothetical protein QN277_009356 [Acacia crassicarpa]|uniref:B box-type domain-containing protein n=1 Tax=Acacia crassicarpa TaxID=499986 RepID=A0AAE1JNR7_9FABA|nr:hypothetical protein QN277_009356 [Acacia crassicarpa]
MLKESNRNGVASNNSWARICDMCRAAPYTVYCRADMAYLCTGCDARIHAANRVASHRISLQGRCRLPLLCLRRQHPLRQSPC